MCSFHNSQIIHCSSYFLSVKQKCFLFSGHKKEMKAKLSASGIPIIIIQEFCSNLLFPTVREMPSELFKNSWWKTLMAVEFNFFKKFEFLRRIQKEIQSEFHSEFQSEFPLEFQSDNCHVIENTYSIHSGNLSFNTVSSTDHLFLIDYTSTANVTSERFHRDLPWISIWNPEIIVKFPIWICKLLISYLVNGRFKLNGSV